MIHTENTILMNAPLERIFAVATDLAAWPKILPHYRWIRFLEQTPGRTIIAMAAWRTILPLAGLKIPIQWTSELQIDGPKKEIRFRHLKSFTKGMLVIWTFSPSGGGINVKITHDFSSEVPIVGGMLVEPIAGGFFAHYVADRTLECMKIFVEHNYGS